MEKLNRVIRLDSIPVQNFGLDEQGFFNDTPIVTTTGIFEYRNPDGSVRRELRLPENVFDEASLASYEGRPIIITHKAGNIDKDNVMDEIVGTILSKGYRDGDSVRCKIVIHDIEKVKKTPFRELSLGYTQDLVEEPGEWNGQPYDAIQSNIRINHLAIVECARAGERAHLNLDSKKVESDDKNNEGGKGMNDNTIRADGFDMTPAELCEAIKQYRASKEAGTAAGEDPVAEKMEENTVKDGEPNLVSEGPDLSESEETTMDDTTETLISVLESLLSVLKEGKSEELENADEEDDPTDGSGESQEEMSDSSDCNAQSMNADSVDDIIGQKLSICRVGDRMNITGLESKSITEGKKAIIAKVLPDLRLDGKDKDYINAAYDIAVGEAEKRKDVSYQRMQMGGNPRRRADSTGNISMADASRRSMIEREGGNE